MNKRFYDKPKFMYFVIKDKITFDKYMKFGKSFAI